MLYMNQKEVEFVNALKEDQKQRGLYSFTHVMFLGALEIEKYLKNFLNDLFESNKTLSIINQSDLLLESIDSSVIGKYKEHFWQTNSTGDIYGLGKEIQNIPHYLISNKLYSLEDKAGKDKVIEHFKLDGIDFLQYVEDYKHFCNEFDLNYHSNLNYVTKQATEFNDLVFNKSI